MGFSAELGLFNSRVPARYNWSRFRTIDDAPMSLLDYDYIFHANNFIVPIEKVDITEGFRSYVVLY